MSWSAPRSRATQQSAQPYRNHPGRTSRFRDVSPAPRPSFGSSMQQRSRSVEPQRRSASAGRLQRSGPRAASTSRERPENERKASRIFTDGFNPREYRDLCEYLQGHGTGLRAKRKPISWLLRIMDDLYDAKYEFDCAELTQQPKQYSSTQGIMDPLVADEECRNLPGFLYRHLWKKFGIRTLVDQACWDIICNTELYRGEFLEVDIFARFLTLQFAAEHLLFFIYFRSVVYHYMGLDIVMHKGAANDQHRRNLQNRKHKYQHPQEPMYVQQGKLMKITTTVFGSKQKLIVQQFLDMLEKYTVPKRGIEISRFLALGLKHYHSTKPGEGGHEASEMDDVEHEQPARSAQGSSWSNSQPTNSTPVKFADYFAAEGSGPGSDTRKSMESRLDKLEEMRRELDAEQRHGHEREHRVRDMEGKVVRMMKGIREERGNDAEGAGSGLNANDFERAKLFARQLVNELEARGDYDTSGVHARKMLQDLSDSFRRQLRQVEDEVADPSPGASAVSGAAPDIKIDFGLSLPVQVLQSQYPSFFAKLGHSLTSAFHVYLELLIRPASGGGLPAKTVTQIKRDIGRALKVKVESIFAALVFEFDRRRKSQGESLGGTTAPLQLLRDDDPAKQYRLLLLSQFDKLVRFAHACQDRRRSSNSADNYGDGSDEARMQQLLAMLNLFSRALIGSPELRHEIEPLTAFLITVARTQLPNARRDDSAVAASPPKKPQMELLDPGVMGRQQVSTAADDLGAAASGPVELE